MIRKILLLVTLPAIASAASAGEVYANIGLPGVSLGYAQPLSDTITLRGDLSTLGKHKKNQTEEGIDYAATAQVNRAGLFADWFVVGGLRLTGGLTFNTAKIDLVATGAGGSLIIGNTTYTTNAQDRLDIGIKFPSTTPYIGVGYGHQRAEGMGFLFDLGASIGTAKLSARTSGPNLAAVSQADLNAETAELRDGVGKIKLLPQVSIGLSYRF